jgi:glycosyltransferase 2 family protein
LKRALSIGVKLICLALIGFILYQVDYLDRFTLPSEEENAVKEVVVGQVQWREDGQFIVPEDGGEAVRLPADWEQSLHKSPVKLGLFTIARRSDKGLLAFGIFIFGPISLISITRWWYLLRSVEIPIPFKEAFRLSFIGFFFNSAVPGMTGGDIIKAFYIAKLKPDMKVRAFMSVLVDRVIGLFALGLLSGLVLLFRIDDPEFRIAAWIVYTFLGACILFGAIFLSRRLRRLLHLEALIARIPSERVSRILTEVDRGIVIYRARPMAVMVAIGLSLLNHASLMVMSVCLARALHIDLPVTTFIILVPVCMMVASIPALPGGWGLREGAFGFFFGARGVEVSFAFATALSVLIGLSQLVWSLLGGFFFLFSSDRVSREELKSFSEEVEAEVAPAES